MSSATYKQFINHVGNYLESKSDVEKVKKAYELAEFYHRNQVRNSGEPYIIHPLSVASILANMHADSDTLCAALLHDTLEDTTLSREEIKEQFNADVLNLVEGVTKNDKVNYSSKEELNLANTRKLINGLTNDVRILIIKLADRLHNMQTLEYKTPLKQKEISIETLEVYSPIAYCLGAYKLKNDLEDLSLKYIKADAYKELSDKKKELEQHYSYMLTDMLKEMYELLSKKNIPSSIWYRVKNVYGIYKKLNTGANIHEIKDLLAIKLLVDEVDDCYRALGIVHKEFPYKDYMFKDYIGTPKPNFYQSLHTYVTGGDGSLVQMQIRTIEMELVDTYGIMRFFDINKEKSQIEMQDRLKKHYHVYDSLMEINKAARDNEEFVNQVKEELFSDRIYVYTPKGKEVELPKGSTAVDFAYSIHTEIGDKMTGAVVNDEPKDPLYVLQNKDVVRVITDSCLDGPKEEWLDQVKTSKAKRKIKEFNRIK